MNSSGLFTTNFSKKQVETQAHILIMCDRPEKLAQFSQVLSQWGYSVQSTSNLVSLFMLIGKSIPKLILLNIDLSEINNLEVYYHLKTARRTSKVPIIFFNDLDSLCTHLKALEIE